MSRQDFMRAHIAIAMLQLYPRLIRDSIMSNTKLAENLGVKADGVLDFGQEGLGFQRSALFEAVKRKFAAMGETATVNDSNGQVWNIEITTEESRPSVAIVLQQRRLFIANFGLLSPDPGVRVGVFQHEARRLNLPADAIAKWTALLEEHAPEGDDLGFIQSVLNDTPTAVSASITAGLSSGNVSVLALVPRATRYYERLIGVCGGAGTFAEYTDTVKRHGNDLIGLDARKGLELALLLASQPEFAIALSGIDAGKEALAATFEWLAEKGDAMSRAAGIEVGLALEPTDTALQTSLKKLIEAFIAGQPVSQVDQFDLLSALFLFTYGEMARCRILPDKPVFWRRMAAMAQAALIARCVAVAGDDASGFVKWAGSERLQVYLLQCFADLRTDPRWPPEMGLSHQFRDELCGRVWSAASRHSEFVKRFGWNDLLLGEGEGSLSQKFNIQNAFLAGPLEGALPPVMDMRPEDEARLRADLASPTITASSFLGLYRASLYFRIPPDIPELAAEAIARANFYLAKDDEHLIPHLLGIASSAAISRNVKLADALFAALRVHRRFHADELSVENVFRIAMHASACYADFQPWCKCVGDRLNELAFQVITREEAEHLHSHLVYLCEMVPELWATCGQAEAAFRSIIGS